ncbi:MAG: hypothetical protein KGZ80_12500 [Methylomonas sp.]|nr:hypothetical protein [Methylomonas sp.]PPD21683.1 MAG: hypothetical protein CTY23_04765 [Methylomonas sp.]PPD24804.1 MAG: hypothetical protein CTY22_10525 [Methylomonas sp.]PPD33503.1 MAG: hypothetical protein CTY21_10505 [Methylomonas sp.]PPD40686.1 MAG: hypothetical protein CTY17_05770 [Methylomonas sp.]
MPSASTEFKTGHTSLVFACKPSRIRRWLTVVLHTLAFASIWLSSLPPLVCMGLSGLLPGLYWMGLRASGRTNVLRYTASAAWEHGLADDRFEPVVITQFTIMGPIAVFLCYRTTLGEHGAAMVVCDELPPDEFRRLMVWLRITGQEHGDGKQNRLKLAGLLAKRYSTQLADFVRRGQPPL